MRREAGRGLRRLWGGAGRARRFVRARNVWPPFVLAKPLASGSDAKAGRFRDEAVQTQAQQEETSAASTPDGVADPLEGVDPERLAQVMREVPKGAAALAGLAVFLLMAAWLAIYFFVFLPRGMVG